MRKYSSLMLIAFLLVAISPCIAAAEIKLVLINNNAADLRQFYKEMVPLFEAEHPGVKIEVVGASGIAEKLRTMLAAGSQVDIVEIWGEAASQFYADNVFLDIGPFVQAEPGLLDKLVRARIDAFMWEGKL